MDWKEWLAKFRLIDITPKVEGKQVGGINVNVEDTSDRRTYNFHFHSGEAAQAFAAGKVIIDAEFEKRVKEEAERRLMGLGIPLDLLSDGAKTEIGSLATAASAVAAVKTQASETLSIGEKVVIKLSSEEKPKK